MNNYVKYLDAFSQKLNLHFQGKEFFPTFLGGMMTIGIIILSIVLGLDLGNELFLKQRPNLSFTKVILPSAPKINLIENDMIFAITILDDNYQAFDFENYFEIESFLSKKNITEIKNNETATYNKIFTTERINLTLVDCKYRKYQFIDKIWRNFDLQSDFEILNLNNAQCLKEYSYSDKNSLDNPLIIYGDSKSNRYSNIKFSLNRCNKKTNANCHSDLDIDIMLSKSHLSLYFIDKGIDPFLFKSPYNYFMNSYIAKLDKNLAKKTDLYFKNSTITTDGGLMLQEWMQETDFTFDFYREQVATSSYSEVLFEISINSSIESEFLKRFYMKIQDLASMIGGIIKISMVIGELISGFFNRHIMYTVILNKLFNFKIKTDDLDIIKSNINMNNILDKNSSNNSELSKEIIIKGNKRLNRRRSAIFLNMNDQYKNLMMNVETPNRKAEKKERQKSKKKLSTEEREKRKDLKSKKQLEDNKLDKIRKEMDLLEPEEVAKIQNMRVSRVLNKSDIIGGFTQLHNKANSLQNSSIKSISSKSDESNGSAFEHIVNKRIDILINKNQQSNLSNEQNSRDRDNYNLNLNNIDIELKDLNNSFHNYMNGNEIINHAQEESIPLERDLKSFSLKIIGEYNKPIKTMTGSNKDFLEVENLNTEKRLLETESNEKLILIKNNEKEYEDEKEKVNKFYTPLNNKNINPLLEKKENNNDEKKKKLLKVDHNFHRIKSAIIIKRRNNIYHKEHDKLRTTEFKFSKKEKKKYK